MSKKLKKAIKDSFNFPESAHKEEFFGQTFIPEKTGSGRNVPIVFRFAAAAAALVLGVGIRNAVKLRPDTGVIDIPSEMPADTEIVSTAPVTGNTETTTAAERTAIKTTSSVLTKKTETSNTTANPKTTNEKNKNTVVSADVRVTVSVTSGQYSVTETTTVKTESLSDIERSFSMKKISAFAASFVIAASNASVLPSNADSAKVDFSEYLRKEHLVYLTTNLSRVNSIKDKESELDLNEDGKFDIWDVYAFYRGMTDYNNNGETYVYDDGTEEFVPPVFTAPAYITENVGKYGDINGDKEINNDDFEYLVYYYSLNCPLSYDVVDPYYYYNNSPDNYDDSQFDAVFKESDEKWTILRYFDYDLYCNQNPVLSFVQQFVEYNSRIYGGYDILCDMIDRGIIETDINGDGKMTVEDLYDIIEGNTLCYWEDVPEYGVDDEEHEVARNTYFTEEEWAKLRNNANICRVTLDYAFEDNFYFIQYFFDNIKFEKAYAERHFFDDMRGGFYSLTAYTAIYDYLKYSMPGIYSPRFDYTQDEIKNDFISYYTKVKSGTLPEPDINMNGTIEFEDYVYADLMLRADSLGNDEKYPGFDEAIIDNFKKNCDFNNNLMSGDLSDVVSIQLYVVKELGIPEDEVRNEVARYFKKHPEIDVWDYAHYVLPEEEEAAEFDGSAKAETGIKAIRTYMNGIDLFKLRNGDANNDGETNMADAVLIMQVYANPDKYTLTDEGSYNADIYGTGDGITPKDAQKIQMNLLGL